MWFWMINFIIGLNQVTLSGAFASYYWAFKKPQDIPRFPVATSLYRCVRFVVEFILYSSSLHVVFNVRLHEFLYFNILCCTFTQ